MTTGTDQADTVELLVFELAAVKHALPLESVREVARAVLISALPEAPPVIEGVVDVRGEIVPVYDLRLRFGLPAAPLTLDDWLVIAWTGARVVAFRADRADQILTVPRTSIQPRGQLPGDASHVTGVARLPDGVVLINDLRAFLDEAERATLAEALATHQSQAGS